MALKEKVFEMHELLSDMVDSLDTLYTGLVYNNSKIIEEVRGKADEAGSRAASLTEVLLEERNEEPRAALYVSVPSHMSRMGAGLLRIADSLKTKTKENVLFSDRADSEVTYMFERIRDILVNARDMVLAPNTLVARHMAESQRAVDKIAQEYSSKHEERLIEGLCAPKASQIYLEILDSFKNIAWHAKEIAEDLAK